MSNTFRRLSGNTALMGASGAVNSLQIGVMGVVTNLAAADFKLTDNLPFVIKNDGADAVTLSVMPLNGSTYISTVFQVGWNPEIVKAIQLNAGAGITLKYGY
jgi:hypothetical protein